MSVNVEPLRSGDPRGVGRYRFLGRLGAGGMGLVCLGRGPDGRLVAVKLIHEDIAADPDYRRRFAREVRAAAAVHARFTAAVVDADPQAPQPWYACEFIDGPTVGQVVRRTGPLGERALRALAAGLAEAVAAFETAGLVHRDLKPDNILLAADGPKVIDFGIARGENDSLLTRAGSVLGSPGYMSPEQIAGERVQTASDVFSLGAVVAFAGQGVGPFGDGPTEARLYRTKHGEPDLSGMPMAMRDPVLRCLAKKPQDRPAPQQLVSWWSVRPDELDTLIQVGRGSGDAVPASGAQSAESVRPAGERLYGAQPGQPVQPGPVQPGPLQSVPLASVPAPVTPPSPEPWTPQTPWLPGSDDASIALPAAPGADGRLDSRLATMAGASAPPAAPVPLGNPFVAREWPSAPPAPPLRPPSPRKPSPWWRQPVGVDRLPGGAVRDLGAGVVAAALLAAFSLPEPNTALTIALAATALALGFVLGVRRSVLALVGYSGAALAGLKVLPGKLSASVHDPTLAYVLEAAVLLLFAGVIARVAGLRRRPVLGFAVGFAAYIAARAAAVAWVAGRTHAGFLDAWRAGTDGLLIYRDAGIAAACGAAVGFLAVIGLIGSTQAVGVDGPHRVTGEH
jgi:serine/threonine protein kinase